MIMPGIIVLPVQSIVFAEDGTFTFAELPKSAIRPFSGSQCTKTKRRHLRKIGFTREYRTNRDLPIRADMNAMKMPDRASALVARLDMVVKPFCRFGKRGYMMRLTLPDTNHRDNQKNKGSNAE